MNRGKLNLIIPPAGCFAAAALLAAGLIGSPNVARGGEPAKKSENVAMSPQEVPAAGVREGTGNMILVGELVEHRDVSLKGANVEKHRLLKVKPSGAQGPQTVIVDIGMKDAATSFGLVKGDRVIAVGKSARINDRPVLFAKSIGELYPVGRIGTTADARATMKAHESGKTTKTSNQNAGYKHDVDPIIVWFDSDNLDTDQYGIYDRDFVWYTDDPWYPNWNGETNTLTWNDNWEKPHWDVWGYDDADEWGIWDW